MRKIQIQPTIDDLQMIASKKGLIMDYIKDQPFETPNIVFWDKKQGYIKDGTWYIKETEFNPCYTMNRKSITNSGKEMSFNGYGFTFAEAYNFVISFQQ